MSEARAVDVIAGFQGQGEVYHGREYFARTLARKLIATSTEGGLVVAVVHALTGEPPDVAVTVLQPPDLASATSWEAVVFRANASALAAMARIGARDEVVRFSFELCGRASYYQGRGHVPVHERATDELAWCVGTLDASLSAAGAYGVPAPESELARLEALRQELARRDRPTRAAR
ncbi:MAG: hypothetical protein ABI588_08705 [Arenimonas sp.]